MGVTRVARVTGLDRTGVEVACAVRPLGHVLQVSNGKGRNFAAASAGALAEAAELWAAEQVDPRTLVWGSRSELAARLGVAQVWDAGDLGSAGELVAPALWSARTKIAWRRARSLVGGPAVWVPAQAIHCLPDGAPALGPAVVRWTTNGMGAHRFLARAIEHALLEAIERDALARRVPTGFTRAAVERLGIAPPSLPARLRQQVQALEARGFGVHFFAVGARPPCVAALLVDQEEGPVPLTAGYAARRTAAQACEAALLEAAQSRVTDIHGAREDVRPADARAMRRLAAWCRSASPRISLKTLAPMRGPLTRGLRRAAVVELTPNGSALRVVKVIIPGFRVSELL